MTIGEKNILAATLNALRNNDLISDDTLNDAFEKLNLPREYKEIYKDNLFDFITGAQYIEEDRQDAF